MKFGDPSQFAIEAELEPDPDIGQVQGKAVLGRNRVWLTGRAIGNYEQPACWLDVPRSHLERKAGELQQLWDPGFAELSMEGIFDRLDFLYYGVRRGKYVMSELSEGDQEQHERDSVGVERFCFLDCGEGFDGWKSFLVRPTPTELVALVYEDPKTDVVAHRFAVAEFEAAIAAYTAWFLAERRRLVPGLR